MTQKKIFFIGTIITAVMFGILLLFSEQQIPNQLYKLKGIMIYTIASVSGGAFFVFIVNHFKKME